MTDIFAETPPRTHGSGVHPSRSPARRWAVAGAAWGAASVLPTAFSHAYFEALGYPLARMLRWMLPSWYAAHVMSRLPGDMLAWPTWGQVTAFLVASAALGAAFALAMWWLLVRLRPRPSRS